MRGTNNSNTGKPMAFMKIKAQRRIKNQVASGSQGGQVEARELG